MPPIFIIEGSIPLYREMVCQYAAQSDRKTVVVASDPRISTIKRAEEIPYIVPDIADPLNREKYFLADKLESYASYMAKYADQMFLSGSIYKSVEKHAKNKIQKAVSSWSGDDYVIVDQAIDYTMNYLATDAMIQNAAKILDAATRLTKR